MEWTTSQSSCTRPATLSERWTARLLSYDTAYNVNLVEWIDGEVMRLVSNSDNTDDNGDGDDEVRRWDVAPDGVQGEVRRRVPILRAHGIQPVESHSHHGAASRPFSHHGAASRPFWYS